MDGGRTADLDPRIMLCLSMILGFAGGPECSEFKVLGDPLSASGCGESFHDEITETALLEIGE